jgi:nanoRNase/pAp phosphatase (c-di-AMP/oligoRNAs hydrolase)
MALSSQERLRRFYERFQGNDHVLIAINADPDAISSAMAVKRLLWRKVAGIAIGHVNVIKRPDNLAMIRLLGVPLIHWSTLDRSIYNRVVMVDSQPDHHEDFKALAPDVIIDHHPATGVSALFHDIRPAYGAVATIMTEYLKAARIRPSAKLATGLFYGIKTDTNNFQRQALPEDIRAFQYLFRYANPHLARKIEYAEIRIDFLKYYRIAIEKMRFRKSRAFVHLGPVVSPDVCVLIADFFMRVNRIEYSVVSGTCDGRLVIIFRNDGLRKNAGTLAAQSFGKFGPAGGHKSMARAEIPVKSLPEGVAADDEKSVLKWIMRQVDFGVRKKK